MPRPCAVETHARSYKSPSERLFDRGRERRLDSLPLPPNRTGGSPASGSPVSGSPQRGLMRVQGKQREHSMHFNEHQHPFSPERRVNRGLSSSLSPIRHSHRSCRHRSALFESTFLHPFAPSPLRDFFAPMGALTPAQPGSSGLSSMNSGSFSEQVSLIHASGLLDHSVSNHLMRHCRRFHTLPFSSTASRFRSRLRPCIAGSPITPGRIEFVILRTGRSPPAAPHHASLRRSCIRLQAGERLPEEDLHLSDYLRFQAHDATALCRGGSRSQLQWYILKH